MSPRPHRAGRRGEGAPLAQGAAKTRGGHGSPLGRTVPRPRGGRYLGSRANPSKRPQAHAWGLFLSFGLIHAARRRSATPATPNATNANAVGSGTSEYVTVMDELVNVSGEKVVTQMELLVG